MDFYEAVIKPLDPNMNMTTKRVADELFKPYTKGKGGSVMDAVAQDIYVKKVHAFICNASDNEFVLIVNSLAWFFRDAVWSEIFIHIVIFIIDQNTTARWVDCQGHYR